MIWQACVIVAGAIVLAVGSQQVFAQKVGSQQQVSAQKKPGTGDVTALGAAMTPKALAAQRGGQAVTINKNELDAKLHDNKAINTISGSNYITQDAFSHSTGLPVAIQNSGNNVLIQNSLILNLEVK
jgi:hypothetical protein